MEATRAMIDMICHGVSAFFGPEGLCYVEAVVSQSRNIPMISYVSAKSIPNSKFEGRANKRIQEKNSTILKHQK